jgi:hypothetical protein
LKFFSKHDLCDCSRSRDAQHLPRRAACIAAQVIRSSLLRRKKQLQDFPQYIANRDAELTKTADKLARNKFDRAQTTRRTFFIFFYRFLCTKTDLQFDTFYASKLDVYFAVTV